MSKSPREIYLRCQYVGSFDFSTASSNFSSAPHHPTTTTYEAQDWIDKCKQQPLWAHWQLECDGKIYEIKRTDQSLVSLVTTSYLGLFIGNLRWLPCDEPELRFTPRALRKDDVAFYREKIGYTILNDAEIIAISTLR